MEARLHRQTCRFAPVAKRPLVTEFLVVVVVVELAAAAASCLPRVLGDRDSHGVAFWN